jgi:arginine/lysine/ornithine decarboxylase
MDCTKVQVRTVESGYSGYDVDRFLEDEMHIITEKSDAYTIMFITTFEIHKKDMLATASALSELIHSDKYERSLRAPGAGESTVPFPDVAEKVIPFPMAEAAVHAGRTRKVPFDKLEGEVSAENITLYPPGIPVIIAGERFTKKVLDFLDNSRKGLTEIIANDPCLETVEVVG